MLRRRLSKSILSSVRHHLQQLLQQHYSNHSKYDTDHESEPLQRVAFARTKHTAHRACNLVSRKHQRRCFQFCLSSEVTSSLPTRCMKTTRPDKDSHLCILYMYIERTVVTGVPQIKLLLVFTGNLNSIIRKK